MAYINTIIEWEGAVIDVRPRFWAAHQEAIQPTGYRGPSEEEFWRLIKIGADLGAMLPHAKPPQVAEYKKLWHEKVESTEFMTNDELQPTAANNLRVLKQMGNAHLVTLSSNSKGVNETLDRLDVWMHFDQKRSLPENRERRVKTLKDLAGGHRTTLVVAGTVPLAYAAAQADLSVVAMRTSLAFPKQFRQVGVDVFFDTLDELTDALINGDEALQRIGAL